MRKTSTRYHSEEGEALCPFLANWRKKFTLCCTALRRIALALRNIAQPWATISCHPSPKQSSSPGEVPRLERDSGLPSWESRQDELIRVNGWFCLT